MSDDHDGLLSELRDLVRAKSESGEGWKPNAAFTTLMEPDEDLALIVGPDPVTRAELASRIWSYIRSHELQDFGNRRIIRADALLAKIFNGKAHVDAMKLMDHVYSHVKK